MATLRLMRRMLILLAKSQRSLSTRYAASTAKADRRVLARGVPSSHAATRTTLPPLVLDNLNTHTGSS
jgi:hypothetical protein